MPCRGGVDQELGADRSAGIVEALAIDAPAIAVVTIALPDDNEVAEGIHRDRREALIVIGGGICAKLRSQRSAGIVEALAIDTVGSTFLAVALPGHDEVAIGIHCRSGPLLRIGRGGIGLRFQPCRDQLSMAAQRQEQDATGK